jgi:hypothetical protein
MQKQASGRYLDVQINSTVRNMIKHKEKWERIVMKYNSKTVINSDDW